MIKRRQGNFFEDFAPGTTFAHGVPRTLTEGDRSLYIGLTGSRSILSTAVTIATKLGLPAAPLEDLLVFNTVFGKTVTDLSMNAVANLGYADVRFLHPVFAGDTLSVDSEVLAVKENSSGKSGVVYVRSTGHNQDGIAVLSYVRWVMVHKRDAMTTQAASALPDLPDHVSPDRLQVPAIAQGAIVARATSSPDMFDDYGIGDRIDHPGAMTINDSDHSIAARLYQNTARPHFDGHNMAGQAAGQRLVYGGHVISVCRSLAYDGLENGLGILAINGGSHVNPVFAGDTLCCATRVLDRYDLAEGIGALRLRMIGAKNIDLSAKIAFPDSDSKRPAHEKSVVLDLDYTLALPK
jgi:2-methylfumaryl-CoA hydratase